MKIVLVADGSVTAGGSSLIQHNERLADPIDAFTKAIAAISHRRNKTEADHTEIGRLECLGGLYTSPILEPEHDGRSKFVVGLPAWNILRCLQDGAKRHRRGPDVLRGVFPLQDFAALEFDGPRDKPDQVWKDGFWLRKTVGIQRARTVRTRPMFSNWGLRLNVEMDANVWDFATLALLWREAGIYAGIGDMRPVYGRFAGTIEEAA